MRLLLMVLLLSGSVLESVAQTPLKWHGTVQVDYVGPDSVVTELRSFISRELRALGDVDETEDNPNYTVRIQVMASKTQGGQLVGYAIHVLVTESIKRWLETTKLLLKGPTEKQFIDEYLGNFELFRSSTMFVTDGDVVSLDKIATTIVAKHVDGKVFGSARKSFREATKMIEGRKQ